MAQRGFGSGTRDAVRKQCDRLKRKGLLDSEERVKPRDVGATRYRVYKAVVHKPSLDKKEKASSKTVQREKPLPEGALTSLDAEGRGRKDSETQKSRTSEKINTPPCVPDSRVQRGQSQDIEGVRSLDGLAGRINKSVQRSEPNPVLTLRKGAYVSSKSKGANLGTVLDLNELDEALVSWNDGTLPSWDAVKNLTVLEAIKDADEF